MDRKSESGTRPTRPWFPFPIEFPGILVLMLGIDPRRELLATIRRWGSIAGPIARDLRSQAEGNPEANEGAGQWTDGRNFQTSGSSILEAELLEVLLIPQDAIPAFSLTRKTQVEDDSLGSILNGAFAPKSEISQIAPGVLSRSVSQAILDLLREFVERNSVRRDDGTIQHLFNAGSYGTGVDGEADFPWPVVDSYSMSVSVCLQGMNLLTAWLDRLEGKGSQAQLEAGGIQEVRELLSDRLTAAMVGLCRSFAVFTYEGGEEEWLQTNGYLWPEGDEQLEDIRRRFRGLTETVEFEIGFTWGPTSPGQWEDEYEALSPRDQGAPVALSAPYFYFTVLAIEACRDIANVQATGAHILSSEQTFLASRLAFLSEMTSRFWGTLAFLEDEDGAWQISDLPWKAGNDSSDYWTLYLLGMVVGSDIGFISLPNEEAQLRFVSLINELAQRGRLTRRLHPPYSEEEGVNQDIAIQMHRPPGKQFYLRADDPEQTVVATWNTYDFAPRSMKLAAQVFRLTRWSSVRERASDLVTAIWKEHVERRRVSSSDRHESAWDDVRNAFSVEIPSERDDLADEAGLGVASWYFTERVVEALVQTYLAATTVHASPEARNLAISSIEELRSRLRQPDVQLHAGSDSSGGSNQVEVWKSSLEKAESLIDSSPSLALALATQVASELANLR